MVIMQIVKYLGTPNLQVMEEGDYREDPVMESVEIVGVAHVA